MRVSLSRTPQSEVGHPYRLRSNNRDATELRAEELAIRERFGLLEGAPLHDVTRRGSPLP